MKVQKLSNGRIITRVIDDKDFGYFQFNGWKSVQEEKSYEVEETPIFKTDETPATYHRRKRRAN